MASSVGVTWSSSASPVIGRELRLALGSSSPMYAIEVES
jgi:hypothetical protein